MRIATFAWSAWLACTGLQPNTTAAAEPEPAAPQPRLASADELLACMATDDDLQARRAALAEQARRHQVQGAKFQAAEADLAAQVRRHAPAAKAEVESYNRAVAQRNASAEAYNREARRLQQAQAALNDQVLVFNSRCGALIVSDEVAQAVAAQRPPKPRAP